MNATDVQDGFFSDIEQTVTSDGTLKDPETSQGWDWLPYFSEPGHGIVEVAPVIDAKPSLARRLRRRCQLSSSSQCRSAGAITVTAFSCVFH